MDDARSRGTGEVSHRSPLHGGEHRGREDDRGERRDRHIRLGVSHPSDDPARHRVFEARAAYDAGAGGWVARVGELNANEQLDGWGPPPGDEGAPRAFPTPAACLGNAVEALVAVVDREAAERE